MFGYDGGFFLRSISMLDGNSPLRHGAEDDCGCPVADTALTK